MSNQLACPIIPVTESGLAWPVAFNYSKKIVHSDSAIMILIRSFDELAPPDLSIPSQTEFRVPIGTKQFRLICPVKEKNDDLLMIQWKKNDEPIGFDFNNRFKLARSDRELKIRNPQLSDGGIYQCQVVNGFGHRELNFTVTFYDPAVENVQNTDSTLTLTTNASPPIWKNETEIRNWMINPVRITIGGALLLKCPAKGNPLPHITWLRDGKVLEREITYHYSSAILYLSDVQPSEGGKYVCKLENEHGSIEASFHVYVENFFEGLDGESWSIDQTNAQLYPIIDEPFNNTVRVGRTAQFQCKVKNQQQPLIKWLKRVEDPNAIRQTNANATLIHANNMHLLLLEKPETSAELSDGVSLNRLIIPNVRYEHSGTYLCVVTNAHGDIAYRSAYLHVIARSDHGVLSNLYFYAGLLVLIVVFTLITYAVHFLRKNQAAKSTESAQGITNIRYSFSLRPPPPNLPPPKAPALPSERQQLMPNNQPCDHYTVNSTAATYYPQFATPDKKLQKIITESGTRPTPIRRTNGGDTKYRLKDDYISSPKWVHAKGDSIEVEMDQNLLKNRSTQFIIRYQ
ncbi:immunoglobulin I-set domain protein [Onchocerca flexuosa]|uniref:receptor protein-tyrosine kinase n=1 Tax=Onchocerca flexuosa TaxID=387005 RepID=A0A238C0G8_9BILA|nr:immunoglobulin I-set domain protein [Onchocerca flexuosa]